MSIPDDDLTTVMSKKELVGSGAPNVNTVIEIVLSLDYCGNGIHLPAL